MKNVIEFRSRTSTGAKFSDPYSHRAKFAWGYAARAAGAAGVFVAMPLISAAVSDMPLPLTMAGISLIAGVGTGLVKYFYFPYRKPEFLNIRVPVRRTPKPRIAMPKAA
jgi:hypothetical protein